MPYANNDDLPASVRNHLPEHAQSIYREAFNHAFDAHQGDPR
jgi:cation transport regulator